MRDVRIFDKDGFLTDEFMKELEGHSEACKRHSKIEEDRKARRQSVKEKLESEGKRICMYDYCNNEILDDPDCNSEFCSYYCSCADAGGIGV